MQISNVINFPDRSSEDESFSEFWEGCQETGQKVSYQRVRRLFFATPEQYFERAGWVYILANPYMLESIYKVGLTTGSIERRMQQLCTTGVPGQFECAHAAWFSDCHHAEAFIHDFLSDFRIDESREFFVTDLETIRGAFMTYSAIADPCPSHMVEQMQRRTRSATTQGLRVVKPSGLEVPF